MEPEKSGEAGAAVAEPQASPTPDQSVVAAPEAPAAGGAPNVSDKPPSQPSNSVPAKSDAEIIAAARAEYDKDPNFKFSPEVVDAFERQKTSPKDGKGAAKPTSEAGKPPAPANDGKSQDVTAQALTLTGAKSLEELPQKAVELHSKFQALNGERGQMGQLRQEVATAKSSVEAQEAIIRDLVMGEPRAVEWVKKNAEKLNIDLGRAKFGGIPAQNPVSAAPQPAASGAPAQGGDLILDPDFEEAFPDMAKSMRGMHAMLKQVAEQAGKPDEKMRAFYERENQKQEVLASRNEVFGSLGNLAQTYDILYDQKANGPLQKHLEAFYAAVDKSPDPKSVPVPKALQRLFEVVEIGTQAGVTNMEDAFAIWSHKNRGVLAVGQERSQAAALLRQSPSVGHSDRQEGTHGTEQPGEISVAEAREMANGKRPIPKAWLDPKTGRVNRALIPANVLKEIERG